MLVELLVLEDVLDDVVVLLELLVLEDVLDDVLDDVLVVVGCVVLVVAPG